MAIYRVAIGFQLDTALPRDAIQITPHYFGDNPQALGDAIKANLLAAIDIGASWPFTIKVYDAQKPKPNFPLYTTSNVAQPHTTSVPRELALCLSYYSTYNRPRYRGRLYIPYSMVAAGTAPALRPTAGAITKTLNFKNILTQNLPATHNWVVYSRTDNKSYGVTNCWVDDEWDIIRSRGMRSTSRQTATVP